jgi:hypothetical protein
MKAWLRRLRGAMGMGVTWAVGWGIGGLLIGVVSTLTPFFPWAPFFRVFDAPLPAMAIPGLFAGTSYHFPAETFDATAPSKSEPISRSME